MFSLLHGTRELQLGQWNLLPLKVEVSNELISPNWIGELNQVLQFKHCNWLTFNASFM